MRLTITTWTGSKLDGIVLALDGLRMRLAIPGVDDAQEFTLRGGHWFDERNQPVEIELVVEDPEPDSIASLEYVGQERSSAAVPGWVN